MATRFYSSHYITPISSCAQFYSVYIARNEAYKIDQLSSKYKDVICQNEEIDLEKFTYSFS